MARKPWGDVVTRQSSHYLLTGIIQDDFAGGPAEAFDTPRLRLAAALMKRVCSALALQDAAVHGTREDGQTVVLVAVDDPAAYARLNALTSSTRVANGPWIANSSFLLGESLHNRLIEVAGPADATGAGRRAKARKALDEADRSLRWRLGGGERD